VRALLIIAAFAGVAAVPCALCLLVIAADEAIERALRAIRRWLRRLTSWGGRRLLASPFGRRLLDSPLARRWRLVRLAHALKMAKTLEHSEPTCPPIEQVAADLRRLSQQRLGIATRSPVWFTAVQRAYDDRLRVASRQLGVEEHLAELTGIDLDLERVRVEGLLQAAGLALRDDSAQPRRGPR
jgi:hypothetical protein